MNNFFGSKYPILSAPMNKISDANLAIAVHNAGGFPSISAYNFRFDGKVNYQQLAFEMEKFKEATGSSDILLSISSDEITNSEFLNLLPKKLFTNVELICENVKLTGIELTLQQVEYFEKLLLDVKILKEFKIKILLKSLTRFLIKEIYSTFHNKIFDAFIIKGPDAAGSVVDFNSSRSLEDDIRILKSLFPEIILIASGGIGNSNDIKKYLDMGADAVAIGTLFAMSKESLISNETKNFVLNNKNLKIEKFSDSNQRAVIFSKLDDDDSNHTSSLVKGIISPSQGHVFIGKGISNIKSLLTVDEIMKLLIKDIE